MAVHLSYVCAQWLRGRKQKPQGTFTSETLAAVRHTAPGPVGTPLTRPPCGSPGRRGCTCPRFQLLNPLPSAGRGVLSRALQNRVCEPQAFCVLTLHCKELPCQLPRTLRDGASPRTQPRPCPGVPGGFQAFAVTACAAAGGSQRPQGTRSQQVRRSRRRWDRVGAHSLRMEKARFPASSKRASLTAGRKDRAEPGRGPRD